MTAASPIERLKQHLRGEYGSIRHRFLTLPKLWLAYGLHRIRGGSWTSFYRTLVDNSASLHRHQIRDSDRAMIAEAKDHLDFLIARGLEPKHRLLDYGCGPMRLGVHAIPYLAEGRYVGADISASTIDNGIHILAQHGIDKGRFDAVVMSDCTLVELAGLRFDFVWANSVVTHMEQREIAEMLEAMRPLLAPGGRFYFSFSVSPRFKRMNIKDFFHPVDLIERLARGAGYDFAIDPGFRGVVEYDRMAVATPLPR
jgi:SAM-dependent methyltransferase